MTIESDPAIISDNTLVSIVTPSFNTAPYIEETILSVQNQTYGRIQHVIIDGKSDDGTVEILRKYPQLEWISEPDKGQSDAINKAFARCEGDIIGWLNSDDTYSAFAVSSAVEYFSKNIDVDLIYGDLNLIDENSNGIGFTEGREFSLDNILINNPVKQPTVFMRRKIIDSLGGVNPELHYVMDRELWLRVWMKGFKVRYVQGEAAANFRICPGTKTFQDTPSFRSEWLQVLSKQLPSISSEDYTQKQKAQAINSVKGGLFLAKMSQAIERRDSREIMLNFYRSVASNKKLLVNPGVYKRLIYGILGLKVKLSTY